MYFPYDRVYCFYVSEGIKHTLSVSIPGGINWVDLEPGSRNTILNKCSGWAADPKEHANLRFLDQIPLSPIFSLVV